MFFKCPRQCQKLIPLNKKHQKLKVETDIHEQREVVLLAAEMAKISVLLSFQQQLSATQDIVTTVLIYLVCDGAFKD